MKHGVELARVMCAGCEQETCQRKTARLVDCSTRFRKIHATADEHTKLINAAYANEGENWPAKPADQFAIATSIAARIKADIPRIKELFDELRDGNLDGMYMTGLPKSPPIARALALAMAHMLGVPFNYDAQNGGALVMELKPVAGSVGNTNSTADDFALHTDDAAIPRDARTEFISLTGILNPPGTLTGYAPTLDAINDMRANPQAAHLVPILYENRFSVRFPVSFGFDTDIWSEPCPVIAGSDEDLETRFPSYAIRPVRENDQLAFDAIDAFLAALERHVVNVPLDAGCFLTFNNSRGAHKRSAIGAGDRLVLRTYSARNLELLQEVTGDQGPIFPVAPFAKAMSA